ncbi:multiheme c-type cytochrome [Pseudomonadota bacterium]
MFNKVVLVFVCHLMFILISFSCFSAEFVGTQTCIDCHEKQYNQWQKSHHDMSMRHADKSSVLGDFNNTSFNFRGKTQRFYQRDGQYWITMLDTKGEAKDFKISYTLGYEPLQQYMVKFDDGRIQLIPYAWDSRSIEQGGQRWFHLYPDLDEHDEFYWTNSGQNWNHMCADCHSTNLQKNFDVEKNKFNTLWSDINVGCEACHGAASEHITWSQQGNQNISNKGFNTNLAARVAEWQYQPNNTILRPKVITDTAQIDTCLQCHSRRTQLQDKQSIQTVDFHDRYSISNITGELYFADGQIYDEVFVGGSFLQSKMHQQGVSCSDCHNPHSLTLVTPKESLCFQCHLPSTYGAGKHSKHAVNTEADQCVTCHMPQTTYMEVDERADHSFKVPRPDLSAKFGSPNVCSTCHQDKSNDWAVNAISKWYPNTQTIKPDFAEAFFIADRGGRVGTSLSDIANNTSVANIIRASAVERLARYPNANTLSTLITATKHHDAQIRHSAVDGSSAIPNNERWAILSPLLTDPVLAVRVKAAGALVMQWQELNVEQQKVLSKPLQEYLDYQEFYSERGFSHTNIANVYLAKGQYEYAEKAYLKAIEIEPIFATSYANLADLYRQQGDDIKSFFVLEKGMLAQPKEATLPYSAGLNLYRQGKLQTAINYFVKATELAADNSQYWYVLSLAQDKSNSQQAINSMSQTYQLSYDPQHLFALCELKIKYKDPTTKSCIKQLSQFVPQSTIQMLLFNYKQSTHQQ